MRNGKCETCPPQSLKNAKTIDCGAAATRPSLTAASPDPRVTLTHLSPEQRKTDTHTGTRVVVLSEKWEMNGHTPPSSVSDLTHHETRFLLPSGFTAPHDPDVPRHSELRLMTCQLGFGGLLWRQGRRHCEWQGQTSRNPLLLKAASAPAGTVAINAPWPLAVPQGRRNP